MEKLKIIASAICNSREKNSPGGMMMILQKVEEIYCKKGRCIGQLPVKEKNELCSFLSDNAAFYLFDDISDVIISLHKTFDKLHIACTMESVNVLFSNYKFKEEELADKNIKSKFLSASTACLNLPNQLYALLYEHEFSTTDKYKVNITRNMQLTEQCLTFYQSFIALSTDEIEPIQIYIVKKTIACVISLISCRLGNFSWTNQKIKTLSESIIQLLCLVSKHKFVSSILSGTTDDKNNPGLLFREGVLTDVLSEISYYFNKEKWEKNFTVKHTFIWCITKVKYPYLEKCLQKIIPPLLLMMDSFDRTEKVLGMTATQYLLDNVNPSALLLHNHVSVLHDVLFKMLYSSNNSIYEVCLPTLEKVLLVIERKPYEIKTIEFTQWDACFRKILNNAEFANNSATRAIFLKWIGKFIKHLSGNAIKFFDDILNVVSTSLQNPDGKKEQGRFLALNVLYEAMSSCWPIIAKYFSTIFKMMLKLLVDLNYPGLMCENEVKNKLEEKVCDALIMLKNCDESNFNDTLQSLLEMPCQPKFKNVHDVLVKLGS